MVLPSSVLEVDIVVDTCLIAVVAMAEVKSEVVEQASHMW